MFCPKCGKADQTENTFCRQCGNFLPDFDKLKRREIPPEEHLKANSVLNIMTAIASLTLAILLYVFFLGKENTPVIIYITAGFLTAMFAWQVQVFVRNLKLKKQIISPKRAEDKESPKEIDTFQTKELLNEADFKDIVPISITENTTRQLKEKTIQNISTQSEH